MTAQTEDAMKVNRRRRRQGVKSNPREVHHSSGWISPGNGPCNRGAAKGRRRWKRLHARAERRTEEVSSKFWKRQTKIGPPTNDPGDA